jgi:fucose 4-O-acetylase-like acetyltransferase
MKPGRLKWIDYARGIAIILVVYRHVFEGLKESGLSVANYLYLEYANIFFFSFRMPLFFIVSGIFVSLSLQKRGIKKYIETRARTVLYPYFLWACIQLTIQFFFQDYTNGHPTAQTYLYLFYLPREIAHFWYLYALFNVGVLYVLVKYKLGVTPVQNVVLGIAMFIISVLTWQKNITTGFIGDILHYYIFFAIGDAVSRFISDREHFKYFESGKLLLLLLIPFVAGQLYFLYTNLPHANEKYMYVEYYQPAMFLLISLTGCAFIMNLTFVLQKYNVMSWLTVLGRHSLYIYVAHVIAFAAVRICLRKIFGIESVPVLLTAGIIGGLLIPVLLYKLAMRLNMWWLFTLEKETPKFSAVRQMNRVTETPGNE